MRRILPLTVLAAVAATSMLSAQQADDRGHAGHHQRAEDRRRDAGCVVVDVRNPINTDAPPNGHGAGRGLVGMRERGRVYDGEVTERAAGDEWIVRAILPLAGTDR